MGDSGYGEAGDHPAAAAAVDPNAVYALGRSSGESDRLYRQADELRPESEALVERAGLGAGDRAIDVGCGPRGILDLLAERVSPSGLVVGRSLPPHAPGRPRAKPPPPHPRDGTRQRRRTQRTRRRGTNALRRPRHRRDARPHVPRLGPQTHHSLNAPTWVATSTPRPSSYLRGTRYTVWLCTPSYLLRGRTKGGPLSAAAHAATGTAGRADRSQREDRAFAFSPNLEIRIA